MIIVSMSNRFPYLHCFVASLSLTFLQQQYRKIESLARGNLLVKGFGQAQKNCSGIYGFTERRSQHRNIFPVRKNSNTLR